MKKVSFVIAGAQKSGTTILKAYLSEHSQIQFSNQKENRFFIYLKNKNNSTLDYTAYHDMYDNYADKILGDKTPEYMYFKEVPEKLYQYNPDFKIIILLRNPVNRAYSQYQRLVRHGLNNEKSFLEMLIDNKNLRRGKKMINRGLYVGQIKNMYTYFKRNQVFIRTQEEFISNTRKVLRQVQTFIDVPVENIYSKVEDKGFYINDYSEMDKESRELLCKRFFPTIEPLERLIKQDLTSWKEDMKPYI